MNPQDGKSAPQYGMPQTPIDPRYAPFYYQNPFPGFPARNYTPDKVAMPFGLYPPPEVIASNPEYFGQVMNMMRTAMQDAYAYRMMYPMGMGYGFPPGFRVGGYGRGDRSNNQVINLDSEEEEPVQASVTVQSVGNQTIFLEKRTDVIQVDDKSVSQPRGVRPVEQVQRQPTVEKAKKSQKMSVSIKSNIDLPQPLAERNFETIDSNIIQNLKKELLEGFKEKKITKSRRREKRLNLRSNRDRDSNKQRRRQREEQPNRDQDKTQHKSDRNEPQAEKKKGELQMQSVVFYNKKKAATTHSRQISKYLESHGEIRKGKEFQSDIPQVMLVAGLNKKKMRLMYHKWVQEKKKNLLRREMGPTTY